MIRCVNQSSIVLRVVIIKPTKARVAGIAAPKTNNARARTSPRPITQPSNHTRTHEKAKGDASTQTW
jgi:hypothetical protein